MITNEQIEADIGELMSEIDRRVAEVKGIFAQVAELRSEADLLKKILILRSRADGETELLSLLFVGYAGNEAKAPSLLCALAWHGSRELPVDIRIHVKREWRSQLPEDVLPYFSDLLADWKQRLRSDPAPLIAAISELSVGPIRATAETVVRNSQLMRLLNEQIGNTERYPELTLVR